MAQTGDGERIRDPLEKGEDRANTLETSGNREESMKESGKDGFGRGTAVRNPDASEQGDGSEGTDGTQSASESGTTSLGGESPDSGDRKGPGGVEGRE